MKRALTPTLNPTGLGSSIAAIYAAVVMIWNLVNHKGAYGFDPQVIVAAAAAAAFLYARFKVTPVADPKDGNGQPLVATPPAPVITVNATGSAEVARQVAAALQAAGMQQKNLIPPAAAAAEQPPAAAAAAAGGAP